MELVSNPAQLTVGSRIAIIGTWSQFGTVTALDEKRVYFTDNDGNTQENHLSDAGVTAPDGRYQTLLVSEAEMTALVSADAEYCATYTERLQRIARDHGDAIQREGRYGRLRSALSDGDTKGLPGVATLLLGR